MKKLLLSCLLIANTLVYTPAFADDDSESFGAWLMSLSRKKGVMPVSNETYKEECGACHFAYPPGLLPEASWRKLINNKALANHFGENAELDDETVAELLDYAVSHSADKSWYKRSRKISNSLEGEEAPLRITDIKYIRRKHHEIPEEWIKGNPDVNSLSNCNACHTKAEEGIFDDDTVNIPNHGPWDD